MAALSGRPTRFESPINDDIRLDVYSKRAALRACSSVVSLVTYSGWCFQNKGCGTIFLCEKADGLFAAYIVTAATVLPPYLAYAATDDITVDVHLSDGKTLRNGSVWASDLHYNLAVVKVMSHAPLPVAKLRPLKDCITIDPSETAFNSPPLPPDSQIFNLSPGDKVMAIARNWVAPYELLVFPGVFSVNYCDLNCMEVFRANCKPWKIGNGGPLVNCDGEVIGISFFADEEQCCPFLPSNLVLKWLDYRGSSGQYRRPRIGLKVCNLHTAKLDFLENVLDNFPDINAGVFVEEVAPGSPASSAGICPRDVIVQCDGRSIEGLLKFFEIIWDNTGKSIDMVLVRARDGVRLKLTVFIEETKPANFNRWR